ncbi:hypothetical protein Taro_033415 [Colocasia esculenta]|uniref:Protein ZIP4 homolog n=1 Tax=Colocasia esculenta TaxID=4460 RepID=A0A843W6X3_COLES|nr:hypothetical protein [Colocasia esculenta]
MRISEISPDLATPGPHDSLPHILQELEALVKEAEDLPSGCHSLPEPLAAGLQRNLSRLPSLIPLPEAAKLQLWKLSYRLWNACVDLSNGVQMWSNDRRGVEEHHASLRQVAADLLLLAGSPAGIPSPAFKAAYFFHRTGLIWHDLRRFDLAASCFERATDLTSGVQVDRVSDTEERRLLLDINLARARTAWEVSDRNLAIALLNRSKSLLFGFPASYQALAEQYLHFGKLDLSEKVEKPVSDASSKFLNEALDLCEKGIGASRRPDQTLPLENLKTRCLRFLAAERLQAEDYDGVLRCVRVMREGCAEEHPSVGFMALKALVGLRRFGDAERELRTMAVTKSIPENVCIAAAEAYLGAVGAEAAKGVLMGLLARCRLGPAAALRVVQKVAVGGGGRARVAAELVSDERVVALFAGTGAVKERGAMHAILWNCGAEHFRLKDHETAAEMFEKSMLYLPRDEENRARRANCYRVLCLCHLGLSRLDQAHEFIDEADKVKKDMAPSPHFRRIIRTGESTNPPIFSPQMEPNINCAFLKLKIYLQRKAEEAAIDQIHAMVKCIDFNPDYLTLAAHEAMASRCYPVAIASLSVVLDLYSPGKQMPMPEVAVLRNLITLLQRNEDIEPEVLKYTRRAWNRVSELGTESFFGKGAVGGRELGWFAGNSWNMGLRSGADKKYGYCADFLELASEFYGAADGETIESKAMSCKALILSVGAMISGEEQGQSTVTDSDIKKAMEMLEKASQILSSALHSASSTQVAAAKSLFEPQLLFLQTIAAYRLLGRLHGDPHNQQLQLIKTFISDTRQCSPQNLLHLGLIALQGPHPNQEAAEVALNACLSSLLASPSPDYQIVGVALRNLVGLAEFLEGQGDAEGGGAYAAYQRAYRIMVGLKEGEYPAEEGKWLAMTAWNRAGPAVRLGQVEAARKWMKMGLDLAQQLQSMVRYRGGMEECIINFEKHCSGGTDPIDVGQRTRGVI